MFFIQVIVVCPTRCTRYLANAPGYQLVNKPVIGLKQIKIPNNLLIFTKVSQHPGD
jgi:hypothetical protein